RIRLSDWLHRQAHGKRLRDALPKPDIPCRRASYGKRVKQSFGLFQITGVEALSEPAVDRSQKICGLIRFALSAHKTRHAHRSTQLPGLRLLRTRNGERALEICSRLRRT